MHGSSNRRGPHSSGAESMSHTMPALVRDPQLLARMGAKPVATIAERNPDRWGDDFESAAERIFALPKV